MRGSPQWASPRPTFPGRTVTCTICKTESTPGDPRIVWVCMRCVKSETQHGEEWLAMAGRFRSGSPKQGETFSVVRQVVEKDGMFFALESIGSTYVAARLSIAERCDTETQARERLGI